VDVCRAVAEQAVPGEIEAASLRELDASASDVDSPSDADLILICSFIFYARILAAGL